MNGWLINWAFFNFRSSVTAKYIRIHDYKKLNWPGWRYQSNIQKDGGQKKKTNRILHRKLKFDHHEQNY